MMFKYAIFLTLAIFALESQNASVQPFGIFDAVFNLIRKLRETVVNAIKNTIGNIFNLQKAMLDLVKNTIKHIQQKINDFIGGIFDGFRKMQEEAAQLGVDVSNCIDENENKIKQIASKIFLDASACITTKGMEAFEILDESVQEVEKLITDVDELEIHFHNCSDFGCYFKVGAEASQLMVSIPLRATKLFVSTQQKIIRIQLEITACAGEKFLELQSLIGSTVNDVNECIADKIAGVTTTATPPKTKAHER